MILHANAALSRRQRERLVSLVAGALTITAAAVLVGPRSPAGTPSSVPLSQCASASRAKSREPHQLRGLPANTDQSKG